MCVRERGSCEDDGREGGEGGEEEEGSLGMASSFGVDSSVPFRPADPTRKVKHTMHYGGVNKKGGPKKERKLLTKVELFQVFFCLFFFLFKLVNFVFLFCQAPRQSAHAFVISTFLVSHSLEEKRTNKTIDTVPLRQISLARGSVVFCLYLSQAKWK